MCDINGNCVDVVDDEMFWLMIKDGKFFVEREEFRMEMVVFLGVLMFE